MSKVLVTGAAGFIGSWICDALLKNDHRIFGMDNLSGGFKENVPIGVELWETDFSNEEDVKRIFMWVKPEFVIHAGAYAAEILSPHIRRFNYENNLIGSVNLINAAVNYNCKGFVFLSSIATYGHQTPPFSESTPLSPADPYAVAKQAVELDLKAAHAMFGLPYIIFRPFNVYGPRQNIGDNYRNVVGIFMNQCLQGKPMTIFGDGEQTRAFSYIDDVAPAIARSIDMPECWGETFNIGGATTYSVNELARKVAIAMGVEPNIMYLPPRKEAVHAYCDQSKAVKFFSQKHSLYHLDDGLREMAKWVKQHGARSTPKFANIEITKNLPESWANL